MLDKLLTARAAKEAVKLVERFVKAHESIAKEMKRSNDRQAQEARRKKG